MKLLLSAHNGDEVRYCTYTILREHPRVLVTSRSFLEDYRARERETYDALAELEHFGYCQYPFRDSNPEWSQVGINLEQLRDYEGVEHVWAPGDGDVPQRELGILAGVVFPSESVTYYSTLGVGEMVLPDEAGWMHLKDKALARHASQDFAVDYLEFYLP